MDIAPYIKQARRIAGRPWSWPLALVGAVLLPEYLTIAFSPDGLTAAGLVAAWSTTADFMVHPVTLLVVLLAAFGMFGRAAYDLRREDRVREVEAKARLVEMEARLRAETLALEGRLMDRLQALMSPAVQVAALHLRRSRLQEIEKHRAYVRAYIARREDALRGGPMPRTAEAYIVNDLKEALAQQADWRSKTDGIELVCDPQTGDPSVALNPGWVTAVRQDLRVLDLWLRAVDAEVMSEHSALRAMEQAIR